MHTVREENSNRKKCHKRKRKRDQKNIRNKKLYEKEKRYEEDYEDLMNTNLIKEFYTTKSPHLLISRKWFQRIKLSSIMLNEAHETTDGKNRVIYYEVESFGKKVIYTRKGNKWILNPSSTLKNTIFIVARLKDIGNIPKLQFHTELGKMIQKYYLDKETNECYVLLSIIHMDKEEHKKAPILNQEDLILMKRFLINQISTKKGNYHFNTKGTIYGLGYGPKCNRNEYGHSIGKFATRKYYR